jgi:hypothetical protein
VACVLGSVYGFLQGAWPFGVVEAIWSLIALRRWWLAGKTRGWGSTGKSEAENLRILSVEPAQALGASHLAAWKRHRFKSPLIAELGFLIRLLG